MRTIDEFLSAGCASPSFTSTIRQIFVQFCQTLNTRHGIAPSPNGLRRGARLRSKSPFQAIAQETQAELESVLSQATNE